MFATVDEIAAAEKIDPFYAGRVLRLTLLAPDIVEAILDGRQPAPRAGGADEAVSGEVAGAADGDWILEGLIRSAS